MSIKIRPIEILDLSALIEIEMECFPFPWDNQDFMKVISSRKYEGYVATINKEIVGYAILRLYQNKICLGNLAVSKIHRRKKIATQILNYCISKNYQSKIYLATSEKNIEAQLFFKSCNFKAVEILKNYYGLYHDAYKFVKFCNHQEKDGILALDEACKGK